MTKPELALPLRLLRDALTALALPMGEQIRVNGPGCVACDLFEDFDHARIVAVGSENRFSGNQSQMLEAIDHAFQSMQGSEFECFNGDVLRLPSWQRIRELAGEALTLFGWEGAVVQPFMEEEPKVWHRRSTADPVSLHSDSCSRRQRVAWEHVTYADCGSCSQKNP